MLHPPVWSIISDGHSTALSLSRSEYRKECITHPSGTLGLSHFLIAVENATNEFAFPRYCSAEGCKADYARNTLNKWLKKHVPEGCVVHSFRHSMCDRLRAVECPSDMIDQIGGWTTAGVGQRYGKGYNLQIREGYIRQICPIVMAF